MIETDSDLLSPDTPIQIQIYRLLRDEILEGLWLAGEDFRGERDIAAQFGVGLISVRAALERLAKEGLLARSRGRGTRASYKLTREQPKVEPITMALIAGAADRNFSYVSVRKTRAPSEACRAFGLGDGAILWECVRVWETSGAPNTVFQIFQRPELGARHPMDQLHKFTMAMILRQEGIEIGGLRRSVRAIVPPVFVARHLGIQLDTPIIEVTAQLFDLTGALIEWSRGFLHPDRTSLDEVLPVELWTPSEVRRG